MEVNTWAILYNEVFREFAAIRREWERWNKFSDFLKEMGRQYQATNTETLPVCVQHIAAQHMATLVPQEQLRARLARANQISEAIPHLSGSVKTA